MLSPELIQTVQTLSHTDKLKLLEILASELEADKGKQERAQKVEKLTKEIFRDYKTLFQRLAKGVDE